MQVSNPGAGRYPNPTGRYPGHGRRAAGCKVAATVAGDARHEGQERPAGGDCHDRKSGAEELRDPDETRAFERGTLDLVKIGGADIGLLTLQPGWRWSEHVKPLAGTELCEAPHFQYHVRGTLHVVMADGAEFDARPGDVTALPQGHDAWVVGDEPVVVVDWYGASNYART
jgi:hypothetical protein